MHAKSTYVEVLLTTLLPLSIKLAGPIRQVVFVPVGHLLLVQAKLRERNFSNYSELLQFRPVFRRVKTFLYLFRKAAQQIIWF